MHLESRAGRRGGEGFLGVNPLSFYIVLAIAIGGLIILEERS